MNREELKAITIAEDETFLRQVSQKIDFKNDSNLENDITKITEYCQKKPVFALAAVQLGIPKRLVYLNNTDWEQTKQFRADGVPEEEQLKYGEKRVLINPVIVKKEGLTAFWEACASCLDNCGLVLRPYKITLEYYDINGKKYTEEFENFSATVLAHEMDHLDGILHIDIAEEILVMPQEERIKWRETHDYEIYSKTGDYDTLKEKKLLINRR